MRRSGIALAAIGLLALASPARPAGLPLPARGVRCLGTTIGAVPVVLVLSAGGRAGPFLEVLGEAVASGAGASFPLSGTAHLRADGKLHLGFGVHTGGDPGFVPIQIEGTLDPPDFDTGSGEVRLLTGSETLGPLGFAPATCPALPG